jgi:acyl-CoA thioester hydrolase
MTDNELMAETFIRVRFDEVDALGIVWHGHYLKYLEDARDAFGRKYNLTYMGVYNHGFSVPLVNIQIDYKLPLKYEDVAKVVIKYIDSDAAKVVFHYTIFNESGEVVLKAKTTQVFMSKTGELQLLNPEFFINWKKKYLWKKS